MSFEPKYFIVEADAVPDIFKKVAKAKQMLETGEQHTVNAATKEVGISRSAFYKYKDSVHPFHDMLNGRMVTLQFMVRDEPGVLSGILNILAGTGANILTINQNIPSGGCALVTMTAETSGLHMSMEAVLSGARAAAGVIRCEVLAG